MSQPEVADLHDLELVWPFLGPTDVIVTGTFDQWSRSIHLVKGDAGFHGTVKVPWREKIAYKFIVDGRWRCREDRPQEDDGHGNINNIFQTPEKPVVLPAHDLPARLSIPLQPGTQGDGQGDIEDMVTALEFFPSVEPVTLKAIPHITVDGRSLVPTPVSESKLYSAVATEGTVPAPMTTSFNKQSSTSYDVSTPAINDNGSVSLPPINGDGEIHDLRSSSTQPAIQGTQAESPTPFSEGALDAPPATASEPTVNPPKEDPTTAARASTSSAPSSPSPHKKRRSLFTRIKHMFDKNKNELEKKEKSKY